MYYITVQCQMFERPVKFWIQFDTVLTDNIKWSIFLSSQMTCLNQSTYIENNHAEFNVSDFINHQTIKIMFSLHLWYNYDGKNMIGSAHNQIMHNNLAFNQVLHNELCWIMTVKNGFKMLNNKGSFFAFQSA